MESLRADPCRVLDNAEEGNQNLLLFKKIRKIFHQVARHIAVCRSRYTRACLRRLRALISIGFYSSLFIERQFSCKQPREFEL